MLNMKRDEIGYIPLDTEHPRPLMSDGGVKDTVELSAISGLATGIVGGAAHGAAMGGITALAHRVAHSAAWDEYDRMVAEADEHRTTTPGDSTQS